MATARQLRGISDVKKRIVPVSDAEKYLKMLVFGRNKQGKTYFAATAPRPFIVDINEKGTKSVRHSGADVFHAKSWQDITFAYWYLHEAKHKYKSVILDTLTGMQNVCMSHVLKKALDRDPNRPPKTPSQRDWGAMAEYMVPLILNYRNLPMNVIFCAQVRNDNRNLEDGEDYWVPDLSPKPRAQATAAVDAIGYIYQKEIRGINKKKKKEVKRYEARMLVGPSDTFLTGNRLELPRILRNPTVPEILEYSPKEG